MFRHFFISLLVLTLACFFLPEIRAFITLAGVAIFICQLAAVLARLFKHSSDLLKLHVPPTNRMVLITGCDSGFGLATAKRLDYYGFYVLAGVLSKESEGAKNLETFCSRRLHVIKLDVTKQEDIDETIDLLAYLTNYKPILDKLNEKQSALNVFDRKFQNPIFGNEDGDLKLWALVNNAGIAQFAPFEFGSIEEDLLPMFEVNVFGVIRVTKACLPFLKQSQGRIVNVGSVADWLTFAGLTVYSMTKHAVRSFTDGLRQELHKFKIKPILIEPTLYKTPISDIDQLIEKFEKIYSRTDWITRNDYGNEKYKDKFIKHLKKMVLLLSRTNIVEVVDSIEDAVTNSTPKLQYWCASTLQKIAFWFVSMFSLEVVDRLLTLRPY